MFFKDTLHKAKFELTIRNTNYPVKQMQPKFLSAIYLLTSDNILWQKAKQGILNSEIDFSRINMRGIDIEGYTLYKIAQDIYECTSCIGLNEVCDKNILSNKLLMLFNEAVNICRSGNKEFSFHRKER